MKTMKNTDYFYLYGSSLTHLFEDLIVEYILEPTKFPKLRKMGRFRIFQKYSRYFQNI